MVRALKFVVLIGLTSRALCSPVSAPNEPNPSLAISVQLDGRTFVNKVAVSASYTMVCS